MHHFLKAALLLTILFSGSGIASAVCLGGFDTITGFPCGGGGNNPPVGSVTISGTTTEGQTLTATNNITDADGMTGSTITYRWRSGTTGGLFADIPGATAATYTLTVNDVGLSLQAVASYTDDLGTLETVTSADTAVVSAAVVNSAPALGGTFTTAGVVNDNATITPFAQVTVTDANAADQVSVAISFIAVNGTLAGTGITGPVTTGINAVYTVTAATLATAQVNLRAAIFTPTAGQVTTAHSVVTAFTLTPNDGTVDGTANATTQITATSVARNANVQNTPPISANTFSAAGGTAVSLGQSFIATRSAQLSSINIASSVASTGAVLKIYSGDGTIVGPNVTLLHTQTFDLANTTTANGVIVQAYTYQAVALDNVVNLTVGQSYTFQITPTVAGNYALVLEFADTYPNGLLYSAGSALLNSDLFFQAVINGGNNTPPALGGTFITNAAINDNVTTTPFTGVTLSDADGDMLSVNITYTAANGALTGTGLSGVAGNYTVDSSIIATAQTNLQGITFTPTANQVAVGSTVATNFTITPNDSTINGTADATTQVTATSINIAPTGGVTITGTATQNQTLTAVSTLADADGLGVITYQWERVVILGLPSTIAGATAATYTLTQADVGKFIKVFASYTDGGGTHETAKANTGTVANVNDAPTGSVTITGTATQNQTLTAANTLADADGLGTITLQWKRAGVVIAGATAATYTLAQADVGKTITVTASYTDALGTNEAVTSAATTAVVNVNSPPTGSVTITGTATQNQTLTAANTLADADGLGTITYQWNRAGAAIANATATTYTLAQADVGKIITVTASYTDGFGAFETVTSAPTAQVIALPPVFTGIPLANAIFEATATLSKPTLTIPPTSGGAAPVVLTNNAPAAGFPLGTTAVLWTATDSIGQTATASQNIVLQDTIVPVIGALTQMATQEATGTNTLVLLTNPTTTDATAVTLTNDAPIITLSLFGQPFDATSFPVGTTVVIWTATDAAGNASTATQNIVVQDTMPPTLSLKGSGTVTLTKGDVFTDAGAIATNLQSGDLNASIVTGGTFVNTATAGTFTLTYDVQNAAGIAATQVTRSIIIKAVASKPISFAGFTAPITSAYAGAGPTSIAKADFNADGKLDLAVTNSGSDSVSILLADGAGGFTKQANDIAVGINPDSVSSADFNADGKLDLAVVNRTSNSVSILLGDGAGGFTKQANDVAVGKRPRSVISADFNADGKLDLAVTNRLSGSVSILLGDGAGAFTKQANDVAVGQSPFSVTSADFNADGKLDLAVTNRLSGSVSILLGDGAGAFTKQANDVAVGRRPFSVTSADFNADGKPDLAVTNFMSDSVSILLGNGAGAFTRADVAIGASPDSVTSADMNGDGILDIISMNMGFNPLNKPATFSVLLGKGDGSFATQAQYEAGKGALLTGSPFSVADVNNDGIQDVLTINGNDSSMRVFLGLNIISFATPKPVGVVVSAGTIQNQSTTTASNSPPNVDILDGAMVSYMVTGLNPGDTINTTLFFSKPVPANASVYKVDAAGNYTAIPQSQWSIVNGAVQLSITDGGPFDLDGTVDGVIVDPVAIGTPAPAATGGGGGCTINPGTNKFDPMLPLMAFITMAMLWRRRKRNRNERLSLTTTKQGEI